MKISQKLQRSSDIRRYILDYVQKIPTGIASVVVKKFKISRQAATRYLTQMVRDGRLVAKGSTKDRSYVSGSFRRTIKKYRLDSSVDESRIWAEDFKNTLGEVKENILKICAYGFTEMVNNAASHSKGRTLTVRFKREPKEIMMVVEDDGVGIFKNIKQAHGLDDEKQAILELSKGKLTTDPAQHTGEGIFFSSRAFDGFAIHSRGLSFIPSPSPAEDQLETQNNIHGTRVCMKLGIASKKNLTDIFDEFADPKNNYTFDKTVVPVRLVQNEGEYLLSRSQAKRLLVRIENFKTVTLDFSGIQSIGPAFADEIFRVFRNEHPGIKLSPANACSEVMKMIRRAQATTAKMKNSHSV
jgi:anti-sigma regulatory factor (Ser/Thr protein kinase)